MNVTEDIIRDLLPAYFSREASLDTRTLVDDHFARHPGFADEVRADFERQPDLGLIAPPPAHASGEASALIRTKRILRWQQLVLALASTLTLNAISLQFSFEIQQGRMRVHWLALPGQAWFVALLLPASAGLWLIYLHLGRRIRLRVLG